MAQYGCAARFFVIYFYVLPILLLCLLTGLPTGLAHKGDSFFGKGASVMTSINVLNSLQQSTRTSAKQTSTLQTRQPLPTVGTTTSATVSLSDYARYQDMLSQIKANKASSINGDNTLSMSALLSLYTSSLGNMNADFLNDAPNTTDPNRLALATQASDYIKAGFQGKDATNPFTGLSRQTLSAVAYDTSGAFTSSERLAAYMAMDGLDSAYQSTVAQNTGYMTDSNDRETVDISTRLKIISGMSDAEKQEKGITDSDISRLQDNLAKLQAASPLTYYKALDYTNLVKSRASDLLVADSEGSGHVKWQLDSSMNIFNALRSGQKIPAINSLVYIGA